MDEEINYETSWVHVESKITALINCKNIDKEHRNNNICLDNYKHRNTLSLLRYDNIEILYINIDKEHRNSNICLDNTNIEILYLHLDIRCLGIGEMKTNEWNIWKLAARTTVTSQPR